MVLLLISSTVTSVEQCGNEDLEIREDEYFYKVEAEHGLLIGPVIVFN